MACATVTSSDIPWDFSSGVVMVSAVPSPTLPRRFEEPDAKQSASISVVFPDPPWPRTTTLRICSVLKDVG